MDKVQLKSFGVDMLTDARLLQIETIVSFQHHWQQFQDFLQSFQVEDHLLRSRLKGET